MYSEKAGGEAFGVRAVFDIKKLYGVVIRIAPEDSDILKAVVQDDLSDLSRMTISVLGQETIGE